MSFGYGSGEFEVTTQRLGCYRPEEHIEYVAGTLTPDSTNKQQQS